MKNAFYACNVENEIVEISSEVDVRSFHYVASHGYNGYNQPVQVEQKLILADAVITKENIEPIESDGTFAYPKKIKKRKTVHELCYLNPNDQFCYTLHNQDMSLVKIEQNNIFVTEIVKPKKKRARKKKFAKQNNVNLLKWDDVCFQPEIEAKYDCNVKPSDYFQYLNNPICDPMFCQFESVNDTCNEVAVHDFELLIDGRTKIDDTKLGNKDAFVKIKGA